MSERALLSRFGYILLFAPAALAGCISRGAEWTGAEPALGAEHRRLSLPAGDPIARAIEYHLRKGGGAGRWPLGPELAPGKPLVQQKPPTPATPAGPTQVAEQPPPPAAPASRPPQLPAAVGGYQAYSIRPGDLLDIAVSGDPDLSGSMRVRADGNIVLPGCGLIVRAANWTPPELAAHVAGALHGKVLKWRPQVSVEVLEGPEYFVLVKSVAGELPPVPAARVPTLGALLIAVGHRLALPPPAVLKVSYPHAAQPLLLNAPLAADARALPLMAGCIVEVVAEPPAVAGPVSRAAPETPRPAPAGEPQ